MPSPSITASSILNARHDFVCRIKLLSNSSIIQNCIPSTVFYYRANLTLSQLLDPLLLAQLVPGACAISTNNRIDSGDVISLLSNGTFIMSCGKDTHETLGLAGEKVSIDRYGLKYVSNTV
jgi:hypothetical protein